MSLQNNFLDKTEHANVSLKSRYKDETQRSDVTSITQDKRILK